jgi:hypothetical protein
MECSFLLRAVDLPADVERRADRLIAVAPGLARGGNVVVDRLLSGDAILPSAKGPGADGLLRYRLITKRTYKMLVEQRLMSASPNR